MTVGVKKQVMKLVETLPFKIQVDKGLQELDEGKGIPHEEVEQKLSRWLSKEWSNRPGERTIQKAPYPLRNQPISYSRPFDSAAEDEWGKKGQAKRPHPKESKISIEKLGN